MPDFSFEAPRPDTDDALPDVDASPLELLAAAAQEVAARDDVTLPVPGRDGFAAVYSVEGLNPALVQDVMRRSPGKAKGTVDSDKMSCLILAHCNRGLIINGETLTEEGRKLCFADGTVRTALGVSSAADAVRVFYGGTTRNYGFAIQAHSNRLLEAAGLGDESVDEEVDPT